MNTLKLSSMEDILTLPKETQFVSINHNAVLYFLYVNNTNVHCQKINSNININEVRKKYINMLSCMYSKKDTEQDIVFSKDELQRIIIPV